MYLTTKSFYQTYLSSLPARELFQVFQVVDGLLQRYGRYQLVHPRMLGILKERAPAVFRLVTLLIQYKKCSRKDIKMLRHFAQKQAELERSHFVISSPSGKVNTQLEKELRKQFKKSGFSLVSSADIVLKVRGGELWYERSLEKDLKKMLS